MTAGGVVDQTGAVGLGMRDVLSAVEVTYRQLDCWTKAQLLRAVNPRCGPGRRRLWPVGELEVARVMAVAVAAGVGPRDAARAARNGGVLAPGVWLVVDHPDAQLVPPGWSRAETEVVGGGR